MDFQWDEERGLSARGISRASESLLKAWVQKGHGPRYHDIYSHESNPAMEKPRLWWQAQLQLYGIAANPGIFSSQARLIFRMLWKDQNGIPVAQNVLDIETRMRQEQTSTNATTSSNSSNDDTPPPQNPLKRRADTILEERPKRIVTEETRPNAVTSASSAVPQAQSLSSSTSLTNSTGSLIHVSPEAVKFLDMGKGDWTIEYQLNSTKYAVRDTGETDYMINNYFCVDIPSLEDPVERACRWSYDDEPFSFYLAQLEFRNLPLTGSKESAKWRLKTAGRDSDQCHMSTRLKSVFHQLESILQSVLCKLLRGHMHEDPRVLRAVEEVPMPLDKPRSEARASVDRTSEDCRAQVDDMQQSTPEQTQQTQHTFTSTAQYDAVMGRWLDLRCKLDSAESRLPLSRRYAEKGRVGPAYCPGCDQPLRYCSCECCDGCGELVDRCRCDACSECGLENDNKCQCVECDKCELKFDRVNAVSSCFCYCNICGEYLDIDRGFDCSCTLNGSGNMERVKARDAQRLQHLQNPDRREWSSRFRNKMRQWIAANQQTYYNREVALLHSEQPYLQPDHLTGTYEIISSFSAEFNSTEKSEIVISTDGSALYGRYRFGPKIHGLFRTNRMPLLASTEAVECKWAVENFESKDGDWAFAGNRRSESLEGVDNVNGIAFLGNGFIKINPRLLWLKPKKYYGEAIFGVRVSSYCEDAAALKESWDGIHQEHCRCRGDAGHHRWRVHEAGGEAPWDETAIDRYVHRLGISSDGESRTLPPLEYLSLKK